MPRACVSNPATRDHPALAAKREALNSNQIIAKTMIEAGRQTLATFPEHAIQVVPTTDRDAIKELLSLTQYVDLCMPRGGESLIRAVTGSAARCPSSNITKERLPRLCGCRRRFARWRRKCANSERESPAPPPSSLQRDGDIARGQIRGKIPFCRKIAQKLVEKQVELRCGYKPRSLNY